MPITSKNPNWELFDKVVAHIKNDPGHFNMQEFVTDVSLSPKKNKAVRIHGDIESWVSEKYAHNACGTVCCFAGWALREAFEESDYTDFDYFLGHLMGYHPSMEVSATGQFDVLARERLGLSQDDSGKLFYSSTWPEPFCSRITEVAPGTEEYAAIAVERFEHFRKTGD